MTLSTQTHNPALLQLPFDQYGRYQMIREALDAARTVVPTGERLRVLDVGGFYRTGRGFDVLPAQMFLHRDDVTVVDRPDCTLPGYMQGDGRKLTFDNQSFDFVISCDTLEHVPEFDRTAFWDELLRVARYGVLLAAPFNLPEVVAAESILFNYIKAELGVEHVQLKEHYENGLPDLKALQKLFDMLKLRYHIYPSGYVHAWLFMMIVKHHLFARTDNYDLHEQVDAYYTRFFSPNERCEPSYRHMIMVARRGQEAWLEAADAVIAPTILNSPEQAEARWSELSAWLLQLMNLTMPDRQVQPLTHAITLQAQTIATLHEELAQRDEQIRDLEQRSAWLAEQAREARHSLEAVEMGTILRLLRWFERRFLKK